MAQLKDTVINGKLTVVDSDIHLNNGNAIYSTNTNGENRSLVELDEGNYARFGYGGYFRNDGASHFQGNEVGIFSKGGIYITSPDAGLSNRQYGKNKVLWSGGYYMTETQKISLSESILAQPNGIVLVWSAYKDGKSQDYGFETHFIPKYCIEAYASCEMDFQLSRYNFSKIGCKRLKIENNSISGYVDNNATGSANGITYDNSHWVLRYVVGV